MRPDPKADIPSADEILVWWKGADGFKVDVGPYSLANAIQSALDQQQRGNFLYITDDTGKRLTLKAAQRLKVSANPDGN